MGATPGTASAQATAAATPPAAAQPDAQTLMVSLSDRMLKSLADNRPVLKKDPTKVFGLIDAVLLPSFNADYAGRLVMGTHYRAATPAQRKRFTQALYRSLVKTYGGAIIDFTADRVKFLPFQPSAKPESAIVRSVITRSDGTRIPVNYALRQTPAGWMVWDVVIEGISYVRNYRNDLGAGVEQALQIRQRASFLCEYCHSSEEISPARFEIITFNQDLLEVQTI